MKTFAQPPSFYDKDVDSYQQRMQGAIEERSRYKRENKNGFSFADDKINQNVINKNLPRNSSVESLRSFNSKNSVISKRNTQRPPSRSSRPVKEIVDFDCYGDTNNVSFANNLIDQPLGNRKFGFTLAKLAATQVCDGVKALRK